MSNMKRLFYYLMVLLGATMNISLLSAQNNVAINTSGLAGNSSAMLDVDATNMGLLIPRVALVNVTNGVTPIASPATSLLVYNTNAAIVGGSGLGYYYWDGTQWVRLFSVSGSGSLNAWMITGNAGTNPTTNFLGTTDNQSLVFRTNNAERVRILNTGNVGIGTTTPIQNLDVNGRINVGNGVIQRGTTPITGTTDLGLYSQNAGNWIRIASNAAAIKFFIDQGGAGGIGTNALLALDNTNGGGVKIHSELTGAGNAGVPDADAALDIESTTKGILIPRMTTAQRDAIPTPNQGLTIYNTDNQCLEWWDISLTGTNKWNSYCRYCEHNVTISANTSAMDFAAYLTSQSIPVGPFNYCVTINSGVTISASTQSGNALSFANMPDGAKIFLTNNGRVVGGGGNGGIAGVEGNTTTCSSNDGDGGNGNAGGHAMVTIAGVALYIYNYGLIAGGGGGGGGGDGGCCSAGGGGAGGAGIPAGNGGAGRCSQCASGVICTGCTGTSCSSAGGVGNSPIGNANATGGTGGAFVNENSPCGTGFNGNNGGNGGSLGAAGGSPANIACGGCSDCRNPGAGGAGGKSVSGGNSNQLYNLGGGLNFGTVD